MLKKPKKSIHEIQQIFDQVNGRYRLGNLLISGGTIAYTRRQAIRALPKLSNYDWILDVACGPGDLARSISDTQRSNAAYRVVGLDLSTKMITTAHKKNYKAVNGSRCLHLIRGNAFTLPFPDKTFKSVIIGYGLRNLVPRRQALAEILRVTKKKGILVCLETSHAVSFPSQLLQAIQFRHIVPIIGAILDLKKEYSYLSQSIAGFPTPTELKREMEDEGWINVRMWPLIGGTVMIHVAIRP
ncbi:MAG: ubiquinone/menaquinone biosynthesis methyltransferase [Candidatus Hodarchaeota archaeon]